jgi:hypothetical protein
MTLVRALARVVLAAGLSLVSLVLLAVLLAACGSSKPGARSAGDAGSDGATGDGGGDSGATGAGVLTFSQDLGGGGTFFAGFSETAPKLADHCTELDAGSCVTTSCAAAAGGDAGAAAAPNAGVLTLTGGVFGSTGALVAPGNGGTYLYASPGLLFAAGDTLGVSATGDAIAAFAEQTVLVLPPLELTAPSTDGGKVTIPTAQPLAVTWTGGQAGAKAILSASAVFTTGGGASVTCVWDASLGAGTVPSDALKPLAAANAQQSSMSWFQEADTVFAVGTVEVTLSARIAQGSLASFQ